MLPQFTVSGGLLSIVEDNTLHVPVQVTVEGMLKLKLNLPPQLKQPLLEQMQKRFPEIKDLEIINK